MTSHVNPESKLAADKLLDALPVANEAVREVGSDGKSIVLSVPLHRRWFHRPPMNWLLPVRRENKVALDTPGLQVWRMCDGQHRVEDIMAHFSETHGLSFHEARVSVTQFLQMLTERGLIVMVGINPADNNEQESLHEA